MNTSAKLFHQAAEKLGPLFGPTRRNEPGYYSQRIVCALRTKETGTWLSRALGLWRTVHIGDWRQPDGYEIWIKSLRVLVDAIDRDDAENAPPPSDRRCVPQPEIFDEKLNLILAKLDKVLEANAPKVSFVSVKQAARITGLSTTRVRRAIKQQELIASNIGSPARPTWRLAVAALEQWMDKNKGETSVVPPSSELKTLIDRHLPGLRGRKDSATR